MGYQITHVSKTSVIKCKNTINYLKKQTIIKIIVIFEPDKVSVAWFRGRGSFGGGGGSW